MGYEDIVKTQAKRGAKEAASVKRKRSQKRKCSAQVIVEAKSRQNCKLEVAEDEIKALEFLCYSFDDTRIFFVWVFLLQAVCIPRRREWVVVIKSCSFDSYLVKFYL